MKLRDGAQRFLFLLLVGLCAACTTNAVTIARISCGGTVPIDSLTNLDPIWSLNSFRDRVKLIGGGSMAIRREHVDAATKSRIQSETGAGVGSVTLFEISRSAAADSSSSNSATSTSQCSATLNPLAGLMDGVVSRSARLTITHIAAAGASAECIFPLTVSLTIGTGESTSVTVVEDGSTAFTRSVFFSAIDQHTWPATVSFSSQCVVQFSLVVDRYGSISRWYVWIPTTVYSAVVVALFLPVAVLRRRLPVHVAGVFLFLVFFGFLGCCIGLVVELFQWQSALGRMFPFPPCVTLYCCLSVLFVLLVVPVLWRQGDNTVLLMGALRLFTYGLNCALCVGYWVAGYVVLGSLAAFQLLVTNVILTWYYAYLTVHLRRAARSAVPVPDFSNSFLYMWCAPVTPFACCALMYYDLYLLAEQELRKDSNTLRMRDVVRVYNVQMSLPLLVVQNIGGVALLATATAFHMPFVVLLFVVVLLSVVHVVYTVDQYCREWSRWRQHGHSFSVRGSLSLSTVMDHLLLRSATIPPPPLPATQEVFNHTSPSPASVRHHTPADQYERDLIAYHHRQSIASSSSNADSYGSSPQLAEDVEAGLRRVVLSTPQRRSPHDAPEYWPSSVER